MNGFYYYVAVLTFAASLNIRLTQGGCLTFSNISAVVYRRPNVARVSWTTQKSGCLVTNWMIHYDSVTPVRIFQNRNQSGNLPDIVTYIPVQPNFDYQIYIEAFTDNGQVLKSPVVAYSVPKDKPYKSPARFRTTGITYNSIGLAWDKLDLFSKNGDVKGYRITFNDVTRGVVNTSNVIGEDVTMTTLTNLQPNHTYQLVIQCINDIGTGPYSSPALTVTLPPQPPPATTTTSTTKSTPTTRTTISTTKTSTTSSTSSSPSSLSSLTAATTKHTTPLTSSSATSPSNGAKSTNKPYMSSTSTALSSIATTTTSRTSSTSQSTIIATPKPSPVSDSTSSTAPTTAKFPTSITTSLATSTSAQTSTSAIVRTPTGIEDFVREHTTPANAPKTGLSLWMIIAIALGCAVLLLVMVLCCLCPRLCFPVAAVDSKRSKDEKAFKKKKMDKRNKVKRFEDRTRTCSGISLESLDDSDFEYDDIPYRHRRRYSSDSHYPLTTTFATPIPRYKRKSLRPKSIPPLDNVGVTIGTQYNEPVSIGTQCDEGITSFYMHRKIGVLSPSAINPIEVQLSNVFTIPTLTENKFNGLTDFGNKKQVDTNPDKKDFSFNNRGTSPGWTESLLNNKALPKSLSLVPYRSQNRGTSPIQEIIPSQNHKRNSSITDSYPVNAPQYASADSHSVHKIEYNTIYRNHVNNTDNTIIQNLIPGDREPPAPKPPLPAHYYDQTPSEPHEKSSDEKKMTQLDKSNVCDETFEEGPLPRVILFEPKKKWSEC